MFGPFGPPATLDYYLELTREISCTVKLSKEQAAVILKAYDYGIGSLEQFELEYLNPVISLLKDQIHP